MNRSQVLKKYGQVILDFNSYDGCEFMYSKKLSNGSVLIAVANYKADNFLSSKESLEVLFFSRILLLDKDNKTKIIFED